jgi:hypothetical protein
LIRNILERRLSPTRRPGAKFTMTAREPRTTETFTICALRFIRKRWIFVFLLSVLVLLPCYWHRRIEAGDLGSHTYNAWLALLISKGQAAGLHVVWQWNNVAADLAMTWLGSRLGFVNAERIVVCVCVLCFFWGAFAFVAVATKRAPWFLLPAIAMISYGYTFYCGFLNYYLSLGLAFWASAILWRGRRIDWLVGALFVILTFIAHPMGFGILLALIVYVRLAENIRGLYRWLLAAGALLLLFALHWYLHRYRTEVWLGMRGLLMTGADQLLLFGRRYKFLAEIVLAFGSVSFLIAAYRDRKNSSSMQQIWTPLTLWSLLVVTAALMPGAIWLPQYVAAVSSISTRLSSVTAIVGLCVLGSVRPRKWILAGLLVCASLFFAFQYQDTATLNRMEQQIETLVGTLPHGCRVAYTMYLGADSRINFRHMVDRACIGKCFAYSNYEPGTGQFRIRITPPGSPLVSDSGLAMELGEYVVRPEDLPMAQIYQSDEADLTKLAVRELAPGEKNGRLGHHPSVSEIEERLPGHSKRAPGK